MIDENAFGCLISYFGLESDEYTLEPAGFVERFSAFQAAILEFLAELPPGAGARAVDLGHAFYVELAQGDQDQSPLAWLGRARSRLEDRGFATVGVLSHGSRWVSTTASDEGFVRRMAGAIPVLSISRPSEALRRALFADTAAQCDEETEGWGPGTYVDAEAIEALGIKPKNTPTPLVVAGATFFRAGR